MKLSDKGIELLRVLEDCKFFPYDDQTGKPTYVWVPGATIGVGHLIIESEWTKYSHGISSDEVNELLRGDIGPVETVITNFNLTLKESLPQNKFDALCIFTFNIGISGFMGSSVAKMIQNKFATTQYATIEDAWKAWNKAQGKVMPGLVNRRKSEWELYCS
jgi:type VI secretion system secreted protein VgrG